MQTLPNAHSHRPDHMYLVEPSHSLVTDAVNFLAMLKGVWRAIRAGESVTLVGSDASVTSRSVTLGSAELRVR